MSDPLTRVSLLLRVADSGDAEAWEQFVELYRPVIWNLARTRGLQPADADDLVQTVLWSVAGAVERFDPNDRRATFRTWLKTIARRAIVNALTRRPADVGAGGTDANLCLQNLPDDDPATRRVEQQYRREIFQSAARRIQPEFTESTWIAFWQTVVEGQSIDAVAEANRRSRGSIYTARTRVLNRLKAVVRELEEE